jgi:hypothetical protein
MWIFILAIISPWMTISLLWNTSQDTANDQFLHFISKNLYHFIAYRLILNAVINAILENNEVADLFFETVTTQDSENVIGLTLYGIRKQLSR